MRTKRTHFISSFLKHIKKLLSIFTITLLAICIALAILEAGLRIYAKILSVQGSEHESDVLYFYVLGGSTAAGEPYLHASPFSETVAHMFNGNINGKSIKTINLASGGLNIEAAYWRLLFELYKNHRTPGVVLLYSGINDECGRPEDNRNHFWNLISHSIVLSRISYNFLNYIHPTFEEKKRSIRDSYDHYTNYINKIIALAHAFDLEIVISTLVGNYSEFPPDISQDFTKDIENSLLYAQSLENKQEFDKAMYLYKQMETSLENKNYLYYRIGRCLLKTNNYTEAEKYFFKAIEDFDPKRANIHQNNYIRSLAENKKIKIVNSYERFKQASPNGFLGYNMFWDAHHPKIEGYILLAQGFAEKISEIYNADIKNTNPSKKEIKNLLNIDDRIMLHAYISSAKWHLGQISRHESNAGFDKAIEYLNSAETITTDLQEITLWKTLAKHLKGQINTKEFYEQIQNNPHKKDINSFIERNFIDENPDKSIN